MQPTTPPDIAAGPGPAVVAAAAGSRERDRLVRDLQALVAGAAGLDGLVAAAARQLGAPVQLVLGPAEGAPPPGVRTADVHVQDLRVGRLLVGPGADAPAGAHLLEVLAAAASTQLELELARHRLTVLDSRLDLALDAGRIGSLELDPESGEVHGDARLRDILGLPAGQEMTAVPDLMQLVHPDDRDQVVATMSAAVQSSGPVQLEHRMVRPDGSTGWLSARLRRVHDVRGRVLVVGSLVDISDARQGREQAQRVLESMQDAFYSLDSDWRFTYVNSEAAKLLGRTQDDLVGRVIWEEFPGAGPGTDFHRMYHRAVQTREAVTFETYYPEPLNGWYEIRAWPAPDGLGVYFREVTERRRAEQERERALEQAHAARDRLTLLAEMTRALGSTLDVPEAMARLARLVLPRLADWCSVTLVDEAGSPRFAVARHRDPALADVVQRLADLQLHVVTARSNLMTVARTGRPRLLPEVDVAAVSASWEGEEMGFLLEQMGLSSLLLVPLQARDRTLGVLVLARAVGQPYDAEDLDYAVEVGQRAGLAIDNAELYSHQRNTAETLQRSLLTRLPEPDHLHMTARYLPAGKEAQVGGDFYWAGLLPDGVTALAIGDVMGHDVGAAAAMGQVQNLLRGITYDRSGSPAAVLRRVDAAMRGLEVDTMATAVLARIEQSEQDAAQGVRRLLWSNAGHPPPVLLHPDGRVELLDSEPDLLLGLDPDTGRANSEVVLQPGSTVLLYTDGLLERRDVSLDVGLTRLRQAVAALAGRELDDLCDELLRRMLPQAPADDVALIAVRAHPEDEPRPAEAGPNRLPPDAP